MKIMELKEAISKMPDNAKVMMVNGLNIREDIMEVKETDVPGFTDGLVELRAVIEETK